MGIIRDDDNAQLRIVNCGDERRPWHRPCGRPSQGPERRKPDERKLGRQFFAHQINWLLRVAESVPTRPGSELLTSINSQAPPPENSH